MPLLISATSKTYLTKDQLRLVLKNGLDLGFTYYELQVTTERQIKFLFLDLDEIAEKVFAQAHEEYDFGSIKICFYGATFDLTFFQQDNLSHIAITNFIELDYPFFKKIDIGNEEEIYQMDYNFYARIFLQLLSDIPLKQFEIDTSERS